MEQYFLTGLLLDDVGDIVQAEICATYDAGTATNPDCQLSEAVVVGLAKLVEHIRRDEVRLLMWYGPRDWAPTEWLVVRNGEVVAVDEEGQPTDELSKVRRLV